MKFKQIVDSFLNNISIPLKTRPLAVFSLLAFSFTVMRLYLPVEPLLVLFIFMGSVLVWLNVTGKINNFITVFICLSMFLGIVASSGKINENKQLTENFNGQFVRVEGYISSVPVLNSYSTTFYFDCDTLYGSRTTEHDVKIYVRCKDKNVDFKHGDRLTFNAVLQSAEEANKRLYKHYFSKGATLVAENVVLLDKSEAVFPKNIIVTAKNYILGIADEHLTGDAREIFKALTVGDRSGFSDELKGNLNKSGLSHITCVSGLHVSILGMAIYNLLRKKSRYVSAAMAVVFVWLFAALTGMSPSTVRSAIMFTSFIAAKITLSENDSFTALSFSAMLLGVINPYVIFDWGFILSFLSVSGILFLSPSFKRMFKFLPEAIADSVSVTISAQLMTIPALINMFGYLSAYSVLANLVVSFFFTMALYLCFILVFVAKVPFVNTILASCVKLLLDTVAVVANFFADMPENIVYMNYFDVFEIIAYYTIILLFIFRKELSEYFISAVIFLCAILLTVAWFVYPGVVYNYDLAESSRLVCTDEKNILLANDSLSTISDELAEFGEVFVEDAVIAGDITYQTDGLIELRDNIQRIHISQEYANSDFVKISNRMGIDVEFYPADSVIDEYFEALIK